MTCNCDDNPKTSWGRFGAQGGDELYNKAAKYIKSWTGFGDYRITSNSLIENGNGDMSQVKIMTQGRETRVTYREYIGDVYAPGAAFNVTKFEINPGNSSTFPWVSPIALQYEQYKPLGMIFEFKATASELSTSTNLGSVMMATDYDVSDGAYATKQQMMNSAYAAEARICDTQLHGIECDPDELQRKIFFVRQKGQVVNNPKDYDVGNFYIATQGSDVGIVGSLYVHYDLVFYKEQVSGGVPGGTTEYALYSSGGSKFTTTRMSIAKGLMGMTLLSTDVVSPPLIGGQELGIKIQEDMIRVPKDLAGSTLFVEIWSYSNNYQWAPRNSAAGILINCTYAENSETTENFMYPDVGWKRIGKFDDLSAGSYTTVVVHINSHVVGEFAAFGFVQQGFLPLGLSQDPVAEQLGVTMRVTKVDRDFVW